MRRIKTMMATTHIDRHKDQFTLEALESMRALISKSYLPYIVNHDPRCPPLGRVIDSEIISLADGEHALEAEIELFEEGPLPPLDPSDRSIPLRDLPSDSLLLTIDRTFAQPEFRDAVEEVSRLFGTPSKFEGKKALEPIAVLVIGAGAFAVGKFVSSFFSRLGSNAADALSDRLKQLISKGRRDDEVRLLRFEFECHHNGQAVHVEAILSSPTEEEIDGFLLRGLNQLDQELPVHLGAAEGLVRYVYSYSEGKLKLEFAVRSDALPMFPSNNDAG
jgi:hypothetical protein